MNLNTLYLVNLLTDTKKTTSLNDNFILFGDKRRKTHPLITSKKESELKFKMKITKLLQFNFSRNSVYPLWIVRSFHYILVFGIFFTNCNLPGIFRFPTELFYFLRNTSNYRISGEILNLRGSGLKISISVQLSSGITRTEDSNPASGSKIFSSNSFYPNQSKYSVEILSNPTNPVQFCSLSNGVGSINNTEVNSILISCVDADTSVSQPVFSLPSGEYPLAQNITITTSTLGASLYYTLNGSNPSCSPLAGTLYKGAILIPQPSLPSINLRAVACKGIMSSAVASVNYTITNGLLNPPTLSIAPGSFGSSQSITITAPALPSGVVVHYTTNGVNPVCTDPIASGPISLTYSQVLLAISCLPTYSRSTPAGGFYEIIGTTATPSFSLPSDTYFNDQTLTLSTLTAGASIYYTKSIG